MLAQDYPLLEVVAVDDRSEDATGAILRELAGRHPTLHVGRVDVLPPGWLGKTNALHRARPRRQATGSCSPTPTWCSRRARFEVADDVKLGG